MNRTCHQISKHRYGAHVHIKSGGGIAKASQGHRPAAMKTTHSQD